MRRLSPRMICTAIARPVFALLLTAAISACGPHVVSVDPLREFPRPVINSFPADIALLYTEEFRDFTYIEERPSAQGGDWEISLGPPQVQVFDVVFSALFQSTRHVDEPALAADNPASAIIMPQVEEFQFALPSDTNIKVFEIWVKYNLAILDREGNEVMRWPFTAYGKTPTAFLTSDSAAVNAAANIALRDAGASMISAFQRDNKLKDWLRQQENAGAPISTPAVKTPESSDRTGEEDDES